MMPYLSSFSNMESGKKGHCKVYHFKRFRYD